MENKMANYDCIKDIIRETNKHAQFLKHFDKALIGTGRICGNTNIVAVYDADMCIQLLIDEHKMEEMEAFEHFKSCVEDVKQGINKPLFINDFRKAVEPNQNSGGDNKSML